MKGAMESSGSQRSQKYTPKKAAAYEWSQLKRKATWTTTSKTLRMGVLSPFGTHALLCIAEVRYEAVKPILSYAPILPF